MTRPVREIIRHMKLQGVSRAELARRLGVSRSAVTQYFDGRHDMRLRTLIHIAHALDLVVELRVKTKRE